MLGRRTIDQVTSIAMKQVSAYDKARGAVCLRYSYKDIDITHNVLLASQPCHYGGVRYWFICQYCHKQAGIIYLSGDQCACRECFKLAYRSEREGYLDKCYRKANAIRAKLEWLPGIASPEGVKPLEMHWLRFNRLKVEYDSHVSRIVGYQHDWMSKVQSTTMAKEK